ncbi:MAG TPA: BrnA antitoxin family protein [Pseudolabrys sp.]|nr:BrnA antitoxin family protein [Pseudolabrys sp.]
MKEKNITVVSRDAPRRRIKSDLEKLRNLTDEEIDASIANDPDWEEFKDVDWDDAVLVIPPKKTPISIRVDEDVLDYFKAGGAGYQRRMNAVLRSYMEQKKKKERA